VTGKRIERTGHRPVRRLSLVFGAAALFAAAPISFPAAAGARTAEVPSGQGVGDFYAARAERPLWLQAGQPTIAAQQLIALLDTAEADGLDSGKYKTRSLERALRRASDGNPRDIRRADEMLSEAFVRYARDLKDAPAAGMKFIDPRLRPTPSLPRALLLRAASAPSLAKFMRDMGWMNPAYAPLRRALVARNYANGRQRDLLRINLERARVLPAGMPRSVIVNAAAQRLDMYEGDQVVDSMRVVVGKEKPKDRTPMLASYLREAALNPYWNVPPDLAAERIASNVLKQGLGYLKSRGYQVLSDWGEHAKLIDPSTIDWQAVADGRIEVRVRQLPGPGNSLGKVKFNFPNPYGVYLHDTPEKKLLTEDTRLFSGGCIRLEDADRFGKWLFGRTLKATSKEPEIEVPLDRPVPVYVTYLTAVPSGSTITYFNDVYGWDAQRLAEIGSSSRVAAR
jgi:L,D-transpeptidase YcbB